MRVEMSVVFCMYLCIYVCICVHGDRGVVFVCNGYISTVSIAMELALSFFSFSFSLHLN
jgi:hypothetical protein